MSSGIKQRRSGSWIRLSAPVTVKRSDSRASEEVCGQLKEINGSGALFTLERELWPGDRIMLYVHCLHPTDGRVRISFPSVVTEVARHEQWEVSVRFGRGHRFLLESRNATVA